MRITYNEATHEFEAIVDAENNVTMTSASKTDLETTLDVLENWKRIQEREHARRNSHFARVRNRAGFELPRGG